MGGGQLALGTDPEVLADLGARHLDGGGPGKVDGGGIGRVDGLQIDSEWRRGRGCHGFIVAPRRPGRPLPGHRPAQWGRIEP